MKTLWIVVLLACLPLLLAAPAIEEKKAIEPVVTAPTTKEELKPKEAMNAAPATRTYHDMEDEEQEEEVDAAAAPNENADTTPIQDDEVPSTEVDEMEEEEEGSGEPELKDELEGEEEQDEELEGEEEEELSEQPETAMQTSADDEENSEEDYRSRYKMRGVITSSLGYQYYIGQKVLYVEKGQYQPGRVVDFTNSGLLVRRSNGKRQTVLKDWTTKVIPLEVPSTCSYFKNMNILVFKSNKYYLSRLISATYHVRLDRGGSKWLSNRDIRPMRVRLCERSKTKEIQSSDVLVRDQTTGGYWVPARVERKAGNNKYVLRKSRDRQQVTVANRANNIIVNTEPTIRSVQIGSRVVARDGPFRAGTVIDIKYNYVDKKTNKKGVALPVNTVIPPNQPWYIIFRTRPERTGGKGISTIQQNQNVVVIKDKSGLQGRIIKTTTTRDGRKIVHIRVIVPKNRRRELPVGTNVWVEVREVKYSAKVISGGLSKTYAVIEVETQGDAKPSKLYKYIKKTLTNLATKKKGAHFYGYHKCYNYFGTVLKNVPENNLRSTRARMVDVVFKTVGSGGTRNVPKKNSGISVKMLGRYYSGMVVKKELMQFTARFRVSTTIPISVLEKVDKLRSTFRRRIKALDKKGFVLWTRFNGRFYPSTKRVTYSPNLKSARVNFKVLRGSLRQRQTVSTNFGGITTSATVRAISGQYAVISVLLTNTILRRAYGKEIDRIRDDVFQAVIRTRALTCGGGQVYGAGFGSSRVLAGKGQYASRIQQWLRQAGQGNVRWTRCFSTYKNGWSSYNFHRQCDNKGPSLTLASYGNRVVGGYSSVSWNSNAGYIKSNKNFLFAFPPQHRNGIMIKAKSSGSHAIYSNKGYGPTFGGGHDFYIQNGHGGSCYSNLGHSYVAPGYRYSTARIKNLMLGRYKFKLTAYEVYVAKPRPGGGLYKSKIIGRNREYIKILQRYLASEGRGGSNWKLCYRMSKHGSSSSTFHSRCNNKGPTITIVKSTLGNIFGGYNSHSWLSNNRYKKSSENFLFSLKNKVGGQFKLWPKSTRLNYGSYNNNGYGPTFGGGHDLYIANNCNKNKSSYTNLGHSFTPPMKKYAYGQARTKNLLAGKYNFKCSEVEVFTM